MFKELFKHKVPAIVVGLLILLLAVSLFRHLSHPLFWSDEVDTALYGQQVLKYGVPAIHDEKNYVYNGEDYMIKKLGEQEVTVYNGWFIYYWAALGVKLGQMSDDLYTKTGIIRFLFTLLGFLSIFWVGGVLYDLFGKNKKQFLILFAAFLGLEFLSVGLTLHLREARYYPVVVCLVNAMLWVIVKYRLKAKGFKWQYALWMIVLLYLLLNNFFPVFFIICATMFLFEAYWHLAGISLEGNDEANPAPSSFGQKVKGFFLQSLPVWLILLIGLPQMVFHNVLLVTQEVSTEMAYSTSIYFEHWRMMANFLIKQEFLLLALVAYGVAWWMYKELDQDARKTLSTVFQLLHLLMMLIVVTFVVMGRAPYLYERMYIHLQPVLILMILLCGWVIWTALPLLQEKGIVPAWLKTTLLIVAGFLSIYTLYHKASPFKGHLTQLAKPYKGALDYLIPFIQDNYSDPSDLLIATNYEEFTYMFYLNSQTVVGFTNEQLRTQRKPDIVIYRKGRGQNENLATFNNILQRKKYKRVEFPVYDYLVNNIAQLYPSAHHPEQHQFETRLAKDAHNKTYAFVESTHPLKETAGVVVDVEEGLTAVPRARVEQLSLHVSPFQYAVDSVAETDVYLQVKGWAYMKSDLDMQRSLQLYLRGDDTSYAFTTRSFARPDLMDVFTDLTSDQVGFSATVLKERLLPGTYDLGFYIQGKDGKDLLQYTNHKIKVDPANAVLSQRLAQPVNRIRYAIDKFEDNYYFIALTGWAFVDYSSYKAQDSLYICLSSSEKTYIFNLDPLERPDLAIEHPELANAGFSSMISKEDLEEGNYNVGIYGIGSEGQEIVQYLPHRVEIKRKMLAPSVTMDLPSDGSDIKMTIDKFSETVQSFEVVGWAFFDGEATKGNQLYVCISSGTQHYCFQPERLNRPDVTNIVEKYNVDESGFSALISKKGLAPGTYQVGVCLINLSNGKRNIRYSDNEVVIPE